MINFGLSKSNFSGSRPQPSNVPGRKFSIRISASVTSVLTISCASVCRKSKDSERLFLDCTCHHTEVPSFSKRHLRKASPTLGGSILTTSAPKSANVLAANGPAMSCPISITFNPASGSIRHLHLSQSSMPTK